MNRSNEGRKDIPLASPGRERREDIPLECCRGVQLGQ
jgi:hypothetical protein